MKACTGETVDAPRVGAARTSKVHRLSGAFTRTAAPRHVRLAMAQRGIRLNFTG
jgi:hypothetical protein